MRAIELLCKAKVDRSQKLATIELAKKDKDIQELYNKLEFYAKAGYDAIANEDKEFFLKSFGIFDRPSTPKQFMLRVRIPGGVLNRNQAIVIAQVAKNYAQGYIDITTRMQIELRFISINNLPIILKELEGAQISTYQTGIDNFRNILTDPLDGRANDSIIECFDIIKRMESIFLKNPEWITTLPRKFNTGISGSTTNRCNIFGQDCAFVLACKNDIFGFNVYLGGKVGHKAQSANIFLEPQDVLIFFETLIYLFKEYGFRDNRNKNRLKFLIDSVGMDNFIDAIKEKSGISFDGAGELLNYGNSFDSQIPIKQKDGKFSILLAVPAGIFSADKLFLVTQIARKYGSGEIRFTVEQNIYITDIENINALLKDSGWQSLTKEINAFNTNLVACIGNKHCPFGVIDGKADAIRLSNLLADSVKLDKQIRMYWSACPKGCGIHSAGDIGFVGTKKSVNGKIELAVDIYVNGEVYNDGKEGDIRLKGVLLNELFDTIKPIIENEFN